MVQPWGTRWHGGRAELCFVLTYMQSSWHTLVLWHVSTTVVAHVGCEAEPQMGWSIWSIDLDIEALPPAVGPP